MTGKMSLYDVVRVGLRKVVIPYGRHKAGVWTKFTPPVAWQILEIQIDVMDMSDGNCVAPCIDFSISTLSNGELVAQSSQITTGNSYCAIRLEMPSEPLQIMHRVYGEGTNPLFRITMQQCIERP